MGKQPDNKGGKREGAGRKPKAHELKIAETIDEALGEDWIKDLFKVIWEKAQKGSYHHQQLLLNYRIGKPTEKVEVAGGLTINLTRKVVK